MKTSRLYIILFLFLINSIGCKKQDFGSLDNSNNYYIHIPNVITIGGVDNNIFYIQAGTYFTPIEYTVEVMEIFDRYGKLIYIAEQFPTNDPSYGWDGTYEGKFVEFGTYSYSVRVSDGIGERLFVGDFSVLN